MLRRMGFPDLTGYRRMFVGFLIDAVGTGVFLPISILFFLATTTVPLVTIGALLSVASAVPLVLAPVIGSMIDRLGHKPVLIGGNLLAGVGYASYGGAHGPVGILVVAGVVQVGMAAYRAAFAPAILAISTAQDRERWFGFVQALGNSGYAVGGLLAAVVITLDSPGTYVLTMLLVGGTNLVCSTLVLLTPIPPLTDDEDDDAEQEQESRGVSVDGPGSAWRRMLADRPYLWLMALGVFVTVRSDVIDVAVPVFSTRLLGLPGWVAGVAFTVSSLAVLAQGWVITLVHGRVRAQLIVAGGVVDAVAYLLLVGAPFTTQALAVAIIMASVLISAAAGLIEGPAFDVLVVEAPPKRYIGRYVAIFQMSRTLGQTLTPALFTWLLSLGVSVLWTVVAAVSLAGSLVAVRLGSTMPPAALRVGAEDDRQSAS